MDWHRYRFRSTWDVDVPPAVVFAVLERADEYPRWWRQVREAEPLDEEGVGRARFRSFLPYDLVVVARQTRRDESAHLLEISLTGDLEGWARWRVEPRDGGARAVFEQEVEVRRSLMRALAVPCRPLFRWNHALMMRGGLRGLRAHVAGVV